MFTAAHIIICLHCTGAQRVFLWPVRLQGNVSSGLLEPNELLCFECVPFFFFFMHRMYRIQICVLDIFLHEKGQGRIAVIKSYIWHRVGCITLWGLFSAHTETTSSCQGNRKQFQFHLRWKSTFPHKPAENVLFFFFFQDIANVVSLCVISNLGKKKKKNCLIILKSHEFKWSSWDIKMWCYIYHDVTASRKVVIK